MQAERGSLPVAGTALTLSPSQHPQVYNPKFLSGEGAGLCPESGLQYSEFALGSL